MRSDVIFWDIHQGQFLHDYHTEFICSHKRMRNSGVACSGYCTVMHREKVTRSGTSHVTSQQPDDCSKHWTDANADHHLAAIRPPLYFC